MQIPNNWESKARNIKLSFSEPLLCKILRFGLRLGHRQLHNGSVGYTRTYDSIRTGTSHRRPEIERPHPLFRLRHFRYNSARCLWSHKRRSRYLSKIWNVAARRCKLLNVFILSNSFMNPNYYFLIGFVYNLGCLGRRVIIIQKVSSSPIIWNRKVSTLRLFFYTKRIINYKSWQVKIKTVWPGITLIRIQAGEIGSRNHSHRRDANFVFKLSKCAHFQKSLDLINELVIN